MRSKVARYFFFDWARSGSAVCAFNSRYTMPKIPYSEHILPVLWSYVVSTFHSTVCTVLFPFPCFFFFFSRKIDRLDWALCVTGSPITPTRSPHLNLIFKLDSIHLKQDVGARSRPWRSYGRTARDDLIHPYYPFVNCLLTLAWQVHAEQCNAIRVQLKIQRRTPAV